MSPASDVVELFMKSFIKAQDALMNRKLVTMGQVSPQWKWIHWSLKLNSEQIYCTFCKAREYMKEPNLNPGKSIESQQWELMPKHVWNKARIAHISAKHATPVGNRTQFPKLLNVVSPFYFLPLFLVFSLLYQDVLIDGLFTFYWRKVPPLSRLAEPQIIHRKSTEELEWYIDD